MQAMWTCCKNYGSDLHENFKRDVASKNSSLNFEIYMYSSNWIHLGTGLQSPIARYYFYQIMKSSYSNNFQQSSRMPNLTGSTDCRDQNCCLVTSESREESWHCMALMARVPAESPPCHWDTHCSVVPAPVAALNVHDTFAILTDYSCWSGTLSAILQN